MFKRGVNVSPIAGVVYQNHGGNCKSAKNVKREEAGVWIWRRSF
jgi:hypothetical protein